MRFDIITLFPEIFNSYLSESILKRAQKEKIIQVKTHSLRNFAEGKYKKVDDRPYGGGAGMVLMAEPIIRTIANIKKPASAKASAGKTKVILFSAKGKQFNQKMAYDWAKKYKRLILISGRYEGIDERVKQILKADEISIGPYVLTDGDAAAMAVVSAVSRLIPGVINWESLEEESYFNFIVKKEAEQGVRGVEYPHYTRPEIIIHKGKKYRVPKVLLSGNHKKISDWRGRKIS